MSGNGQRLEAVWRRMDPHRTLNAFDAVAWRAPSAKRFDSRPANDHPAEPSLMDELRALPGWVIPVAGGVVSALMGMMLGGMLRI